METIIFYNLYQNGDIYLTIKFIEDIKKKINYKIEYIIKMNKKSYKQYNINFVEYNTLSYNDLIKIDDKQKVYIDDNKLYYNLHIAKMGNKPMPENYIDLKYLYESFKKIYELLEIEMEDDYEYYTPCVKNIYDIDIHFKDSILICNGQCHSGQIDNNYSIDFLIEELKKRYMIFLTHKIKKYEKGQYELNYIQDIYNEKANIDFIGFFARCVDIIIGKDSGLFYWTQNRDTIDKKFVCFSLEDRCCIDKKFNTLKISPKDTNKNIIDSINRFII